MIEAPPRPPVRADELEALIREARRRARRRRLALAAVVAAAAGAGVGGFFAAGGGGGGSRTAGEPSPAEIAAAARRVETVARRAPIVDAGLSGPVGWAMNGLGLWLTPDGGATWLASLPQDVRTIGDPVARITQIEFADRAHGWISAAGVIGGPRPPRSSGSLRHMEIDRTSDGGRTWLRSIPPGCLAACGGAHLSFLDDRDGFALTGVSPEPRLYRTRDGGAHWTLVSHPPFSGAVVFLDDRDAFGVGDPTGVSGPTGNTPVGGGLLYRTADGGRTWRRVTLAPPAALAGEPATADLPRFFGERGVVSVRYRDRRTHAQRVVVYVSADGGATWAARAAPASADVRRYSWGFPDATPFSAASGDDWVLMVGRDLYWTHDAGRSWQLVHATFAPAPPRVFDVRFTSPAHGWAIFDVGNGAALVQTSDGGRDWTPLAPPVPKLPHYRPKPICNSPCRRP